jgi:hypothetical protein
MRIYVITHHDTPQRAYLSRKSANASARAFLRRRGRALEEWMDEDGCYHGEVLVARAPGEEVDDERVTEMVWVTGVEVADAEDDDDDDEKEEEEGRGVESR